MEPTTIKSSIPHEIVFEIFSRLPVKSLMRFKCVSQICNSLISESVFVDSHQCRTSEIKFIVRQRTKLYTIKAMEEGKASPLHIDNLYEILLYNHLMCVNGLFCCWIEHMECVVICNPSTKVVRSLPRLKELPKIIYTEHFYSMGFDPEKKTYKVLMTFNGYFKGVARTRNLIFTLGTDKSWREITGSITYFVVTSKNIVCINGVIYMLSYAEENIFIVAFNVNSENFRIITLWNSLDHYKRNHYNVIEVNDKLAILDKKNLYSRANMDLLILGDKDQWEKHIIQIPQQWRNTQFGWPTFCNTCDGEILFTNRVESRQFMCFCYNVTEKRWRNFEIQGLSKKKPFSGIYSYDESLFPVERICNNSA